MWNSHFQPQPLSRVPAEQLGDIPAVRYIPYDHVATFSLTGEVGRLHEDVINISVEGVFVAQEIGYGFAAERAQTTFLRSLPPPVSPPSPPESRLADATLGNLTPDVLISGFRFNPAFERLAFPRGTLDPNLDAKLADLNSLDRTDLLQRVERVDEIHFLFQIIDSGSGRELQNEPIHNIAGLGKSNGERPFRVLANPVAFLPRSTIRIQVEEASLGINGELAIALHGYKILGAAHVPETQLRAAPSVQRAAAFYGSEKATARILKQIREGQIPRQRLVPFDYVATFDLTGQPENLLEDEVNINVEGGFVATAIGYSLVAADREVQLFPAGEPGNFALADIPFSQFPASALKEGFRIRPDFVCLAFQNGQLANLPKETINRLFERLTLPEDVRFKFRIIDTGTGRELQNKTELNIAGLGIANGDRPFRELAYPMHFLPRSTIRVQVEEIFGRGRLFIVFQGYKILGSV
ncbi:MAG: hypothetical protein ONB46_10630 [candidate division KSB1 bacterium]|nr:hypothetical protein [candidate division KSB1 bacterium]MDZ7366260.1 hypothetical protein [candidate division KSB1 bacterium]MDZ7404478.1 hypothetical protein [candidate division KSB1 bacterium]